MAKNYNIEIEPGRYFRDDQPPLALPEAAVAAEKPDDKEPKANQELPS